jgi:hypothetical protein
MKSTFLKFSLLAMLPLFLFTSCEDDDSDVAACEADSLSEVIVGTWLSDYDPNTVTFNADGTLNDPDDVVFAAEVNGVVFSEKTYEVRSNTELYVKATDPNDPNNSADATIDVTSFDCDEFVISIAGFTGTFTRQ